MPETNLQRFAIGIDVGATKTASVLITPAGEIVAQHYSLTQASDDRRSAFETIVDHIKRYQDEFSNEIIGIGIGAPGWHDLEKGIIKNAVNLGWDDFNIVGEIQERCSLSLPILHQTDALAETMGEYYYGAAQHCSDFVYLGVGSGLGSGFFCNDRLVTGHKGMAGGIGHYAFGTTDSVCVCGLTGCIEQRVGGLALCTMLKAYPAERLADSQLRKEDLCDARSVLAAAHDQDELAENVFAEMGKWLGVVMSMYMTLLNPKMIVIGGGLGKAAYSLFVPAALKEVQNRTLSFFWEDVELRKSSVRNSAMGAASLVWEYDQKEVMAQIPKTQ